ncbi:hypothetical protein LCGC14_2553580, partial [marine sediment metagenome]
MSLSKRKGMRPLGAAWVMTYVLAGAKVARLIDSGEEEEARKWLTNLTSVLSPSTDVSY